MKRRTRWEEMESQDRQVAAGTRHALTKGHYEALGPDTVRVVYGERSGLFDRFGGWIEGELRHCDPQLCIWLTGLHVVQARTLPNPTAEGDAP